MEKEIVKRLAPTKDTLNLLFSLCGNVCAYPGCEHPVFNEKNKFIAQVCHIESANEGGERFNSDRTNEERRQYSNLVVMCYEHHQVTNDVITYTVEKMCDLKTQHENRFRKQPSFASNDQIDEIYDLELQKSIEKVSNNTDKIIIKQDLHTELLTKILNQLPEPSEKAKSDFDRQIDNIIALRKTNQQKSAISLFEKLKSDDWERLSPKEKYRIDANLGILYLDLLENEKAANYFLESLKYQPEDPKAINWGILGYSLLGKIEQAKTLIAKGLTLDPENIGMYGSLVRINSTLTLTDVLELIPEKLRRDHSIAYEISRNCLKQGNYNDAITWAQIALDAADENKFELKAILASTILESFLQPYQAVTGQVSQEIMNKAKYVISLYTQAWDEVKYTDLRVSRVWFLINRSIAKTYLGDLEGSYLDTKEALQHSQDDFIKRHVAVSATRIGKTEEALNILSELNAQTTDNEKVELKIFEAEIRLKTGQTEVGIEMMKELLKDSLSDDQKNFIAVHLSEYFLNINDLEQAQKFYEIVLSIDENALPTKILYGKILLKEGKKDAAIEKFMEALQKIDENSKELEIYDLAEQLERLSLFDESISLFEKITNFDNYSSQARRLLHLYQQAGQDAKLLEACKRLIFKNGPISEVTELKSYIYEKIYDYTNAIATCLEHLAVYPDDQHVQIRLALIYSQKEDWQNVRGVLSKINHLDRKIPMDVQFKVALLCHHAGENDKFRAFAYETRRQFQENVLAHEKYISINTIQTRDEKRSTNPTEIGLDCSVTVSEANTKISYLIEDRHDLSRVKAEIAPNSPEGLILMGKKVGDVIVLGNYGKEYTITEILHKYNAAMRESFSLIQTTFATQTNFRQFSIGQSGNFEEDFKPLLENIDAVTSHDQMIEEIYREGNLPLSTIASSQKTNLIKIWGKYISNEELGLITTDHNKEVLEAFKNFDNKTPLILDVISLSTIAQLDCYNEIELLECRLFVAESSILVINDLIRELKADEKTGTLSYGKKGQRYTHHMSTPADIENQIKHLMKLSSWIKEKFTSLPCTASLKLKSQVKEELNEALGESTIETILTAQENNYVLYAEETIVRRLALDQHQTHGISTFMVLPYLFTKAKISRKRYNSLSVDLIGLNYKFVPVDVLVLLEATRRTEYMFEYPLTYVLKGLNSHLASDEFMLKTVCNYFMLLYRHPIDFIIKMDIQQLRQTLVIKTLEVLSSKFDIKKCEKPILEIMKIKFGAKDPDYLTIEKIIQNFCAH